MDPVSALLGVIAGAVSLLFWVARLIYTGKLVPGSTVAMIKEERDEWKATANTERDRNQVIASQLTRVTSVIPPVGGE